MIKEKAYKYKNYQISYDEGLIDRSALVIGTKEKDTLYITGELYDESANAVIKILDNLQTQLQQKENIIKEVREYIKKYRTMVDGYEDEKTGQMIYEHRLKLNKHQVRHLLEILNKVD